MTFPRGLTPSDKERSAITQTRMSPGAAGGISRHVRRSDRPAQTQQTGGSVGVVAAGLYGSSAYGAGGLVILNSLNWSWGGIEEHVSLNGDGSLGLLTIGWYQASAVGAVGATPGANMALSVNMFLGYPRPPLPQDGNEADAGGQANLYAASLPFYNDAAYSGGVSNIINIYVGNAAAITLPVPGVTAYVVKLPD